MAIDRNRGCTIRFHPQGFRVVVYKDAPGEFWAENGEPLSPEIARAAGFDVRALLKERTKQQRMAELKAQVEREFASREEALAAEMNDTATGAYSVRHIGGGKYAIVDSEGKRLTTEPATKEQCEALLAELESTNTE